MPAAAEAAAGKKKGKRVRNKILVFGDSITYGQLDPEMGGWVNRLRLNIANDSSIVSCHVFNMGISGQSSGEILERMERECRGRVMDDANNIIVIACGINDTRIVNGSTLASEGEFRKNVSSLISCAGGIADHVICAGLTPVDESRTNPVWWDRSQNWRNDYIRRYDEIIKEVCSEEGVRYVRLYDLIDAESNGDGLHPSAAGHAAIADVMTSVIYEYLNREGSFAAIAKPAGIRVLPGRIIRRIRLNMSPYRPPESPTE